MRRICDATYHKTIFPRVSKEMYMKKTIIRITIHELFMEDLLNWTETKKLINQVKFLSEKDTNLWYNALVPSPITRDFYNF